MIVIVVIKEDFEGRAFAKKMIEEDTYIFDAASIRDRGDSYMIVPKENEDQKLRWNWNKRNVKFIGIFS